jgi:hypothetical protein
MVVNRWGSRTTTVPICPGRLGLAIVDVRANVPGNNKVIVVNCGTKSKVELGLASDMIAALDRDGVLTVFRNGASTAVVIVPSGGRFSVTVTVAMTSS